MDVVCDGEGKIPVMDLVDGINSKVDRAGDTMTGQLALPGGGTGTEALQADEIATFFGMKLSTSGEDITKNDDSWIKNQCTAWGFFNGKETVPVIYDSYNIASITRLGTGAYNIAFTDTMDNAHYAPVANADDVESFGTIDVPTVDGFKLSILDSSNGAYYDDYVAFIIFGGKL